MDDECDTTARPAAARRPPGRASPSAPSEPAPRLLDQVMHLASAALPGITDASVTVTEAGHPRTVACTSVLALALDAYQHRQGGPCLDAALPGLVVEVPDTGDEPRYPAFAGEASRRGVTRSLSVGLDPEGSGALTVYACSGTGFDPGTTAAARSVATTVSLAVGDAASYGRMEALVAQMQQAMASRSVIEQAKGIVMAGRGCGPDEAFVELRRLASQSERKLPAVAEDIVSRRGRPPGRGR